ncbi:MAG: HlyD family secretion protein [Spirochaetaceae bacterium]|nr:HlyD family secretion protein [Spirochaetaceae bacterium]
MYFETRRHMAFLALFVAAVAALSLAGCAKPSGISSAPVAAGASAGTSSGAAAATAKAAPEAGSAAVAAPGAVGEGAAKSPEGQGPRRIPAVTVQGHVAVAGTLSADRDTAGVVAPSVTSQVAAQVSGYVAKVLRQSGDWVAAGEVVVRLEETALGIALANAQAALETAKINLAAVQDATSQANVRLALQVESAQATLNSAQRTYDSQKALFAIGGISAAALDTAGSQLAKAQAELESAKTALEQNKRGFATTATQNVESLKIAVAAAGNNLRQAEFNLANASIKAPFAGQVSAINVAPGMFVGQSTSVFALVSRERQVNFGVAPSDAPALAQGTPIDFESGGVRHRLKIRYSPSAPVNGIVPMAALPLGKFELPFGTVGNLRYRVALARGVIVPITALETQETRNYVFTVEKGKAAIRYVTIVAESGAEVALTGISGGAVVILNAPPGLLPGAGVQAVMAARASASDSPAPAAAGRP